MKNAAYQTVHLSILAAMFSAPALAQNLNIAVESDPRSMADAGSSETICGAKHLRRCAKDILRDQAGIWTSPLRLQPQDAEWLGPLAAATATNLHYDAQLESELAEQELGITPNRVKLSGKFSNIGSGYALVGTGAGLYVLGSWKHDSHLAETGRLGLEAIIDATLVDQALKFATNRERPLTGMGTGRFWPHGTRDIMTSSAFPSGHAIASWALARVVVSEYPGKLTQFGAYTLATIVSLSRITAREHFPSDVIVGTTFGYLIGGYVMRHHSSKYSHSPYSVSPFIDHGTRTYGMTFAWKP